MQESQTKRKSHKRSKTGCARCKGRHVRCDELVPVCGNCLKYGHDCSLSEPRSFEVDVKSPNDFTTAGPREAKAQDSKPEPQQPQPQQPQYSQYEYPQESQYSQYPPHPQSYESYYPYTIAYQDPLRSDLTPEAISALNCYLQVCAESPLPTYYNQTLSPEEYPNSASTTSDHSAEGQSQGYRSSFAQKY